MLAEACTDGWWNDQGEVPRISASDITPEEFEARYIKRGMPVVLTVTSFSRAPAFAKVSGIPNPGSQL